MTKATVYLEPHLHKALKVKAAETDSTISEIVNQAIKAAFLEDAADLKAVRARRKEPRRSFEAFLKDLKRDGLL